MSKNTKKETSEKKETPKKRFHKTRKFCGFSIGFLLEIFLICLMLFILAAGALFYKLAKNELDVEFAKRHLQKTINAEIAPYKIKTEAFNIEWQNIFERPVFHIEDFSFLNTNDETLLTLEDLYFTLSRSKLILGDIVPKEISASGLDLHFVRNTDGSVQLGFVAGPSYILFDGTSSDEGGDFTNLDDIYQTHLAPVFERGFLKGLKDLKVSNSSIVFEDISKDYALSFPSVTASLKPSKKQIKLNTDFRISSGKRADLISSNMVYDIDFKELSIGTNIENFNPFLWTSLFDIEDINSERSLIEISGNLSATFDDQFNLQASEIDTTARAGKFDIPKLYNDPFEFQELVLKGFFNRQALTLDLKDSLLKAYDLEIGIGGSIPVFSESIKEYSIPLQFNIPLFNVPLKEKAFPDAFEDKPIYKWLTQRLTDGVVTDMNMNLVIDLFKDAEDSWDGDLGKLLADFKFENLDVDYKNPMVPLTNATGSAIIDSGPDKMTITASKGNFKDIALSEITVGIQDLLAPKKSTISLDFKADGAFKDYLDYLAKDPININKNIEFDPNAVKGQGRLHAKMEFSTKKDLPLEEIKMDIQADLKDMLIPKLVKNLDVSSPLVKFSLVDGLMKAEGRGVLSNRDGNFKWQQYIKSKGKPFKMKVDAKLPVDANLRRHFGIGIDDFVTGTANVDLIYTSYPDKTAEVLVEGDLTNAELHYDLLGYKKPVGEKGITSLTAKLENDQIRSVSSLMITAPELSIENARLIFQNGDLKRGEFNNNKIGETQADLELVYDTRQDITLNISGERLDARPILEGNKREKEYDGPSIRAFTQVKQLLTHKDQFVSDTKVFMSMLRNGDINQFEMDGTSGKGNVYVRYKPDETGSPTLRAEFTDAGAALRAFGMYQNVKGGRLTITGTSADQVWDGNVSGNFLLQNFSVRKAPVLAKLINAMSLPGLGQLLGNDGVIFSKLRANFKWTSRPEGALITVRDGRTSGSELGLTFEGNINRSTNTVNLEGTIVPASTLNNLIGDIPLLGPIITGGTGALIAATYKIKGPYDKTEVRINPLSALAPGIVRRILFED